MIFRVIFKTPDCVNDAIIQAIEDKYGSDSESEEQFIDECKAVELCDKFTKYGELVTIEFDTEKATAIVVG